MNKRMAGGKRIRRKFKKRKFSQKEMLISFFFVDLYQNMGLFA